MRGGSKCLKIAANLVLAALNLQIMLYLSFN